MRQLSAMTAGAWPSRSWRAVLAAVLALVVLVLAPLSRAEARQRSSTVTVKVMTRDVFVGANFTPALRSAGFADFIAINGAILREVDRTNFPLRARGLAAEIRKEKPDLVGLQEVALWRTGPFNTQAALEQRPVATTVKYDYLALLLDRLNRNTSRKGYRVAVVGNEFDFEAPADYDGDPGTGMLGAEMNGRLTMRDVILVRRGGPVKVARPRSGHFETLWTPTVSGLSIPFVRGWVSVDAIVEKRTGRHARSARFRLVNTRLEGEDPPSIRAQQASELVAGPARSGRTILIGDFESGIPAAKPGYEQAYQRLLDAGFTERSVDRPASCCVRDLFASPPSEFDHQVDHMMTNMSRRQVRLAGGVVTGRKRVNGMYNAEHAGLVSKLILRAR